MNRYEGVTTEAPRGDWMQTYSGGAFYPADPRPEDICIEDIAHGLGMVCRYAGQCNEHYSVAEHSLLVSHMVPEEHALAALMHDSPEAYLGDAARPWKVLVPQYKALEERVWHAICARFGLSPMLPPCVHEADNQIMHSEREINMQPPPLDWGVPDNGQRVHIMLLSNKTAERAFLARFKDLTR